MQSTISLLSHLKSDYPQFLFELGEDFSWSSSDNTIFYTKDIENNAPFLLHELSHAILNHTDYNLDIQLITMERQAWDYAIKLASLYNIVISDQIVQSTVDSYRDWLYMRSCCPKCKAIGVQTEKYKYKCPACTNKWRVNEARLCALRRYDIK